MKIVKYVFLLIILAALALTVFIATQNGKYTVEQQKVIYAPRAVLYGYVNDYENWQNLNLLTGTDSTATYTLSGNTAGKGATMAWKKDGTDGTIQTITATDNDSIRQKAVINGLNSDIRWAFKDTVGATKVTIKINGELSFTEKAQALFEHGNIDRTFEAGISRGLDNLNVFLVSDLKKFDISVKDIVLKNGAFYLGHTITSTKAEVNKIAAATFQKLFAFTKKNKIVVAGAPFILYKNFKKGRDTITYTLSIPIKEEIYTMPGSEYEGGRLMPFNALKTSLKGDYSHLSKAWDAAYKHIAEKGFIENPALPYVVNYAKNINDTRRPSNWVSDIYIPIGPALQTPADTLQVPVPQLTPVTAAPATPNRSATATPASGKTTTTSATTKPNKTAAPATAKPATTTATDKTPAKQKAKQKPAPVVKKDSLKEFR